MLSEEDELLLSSGLRIANMWARRAELLHEMIENCYQQRSVKGLDFMVAFNFDASGVNAQIGAGGGMPVGKYPVVAKSSALEATQSGQGGKLVLGVEIIDGPMKGVKGNMHFTLQHVNADTVRIAKEHLACVSWCVGNPGGSFQDTAALHEKPFVVEYAPQKKGDGADKGYTELVGVWDMNGRTAKDIASGNSGGNNNGGGSNFAGNNNGGNGFGGGDAGNNGQQNGNGGFGGNGGDNSQQNGNGGGWQQGGPANQGGGNGGGWQQNGAGAGGNGGAAGGWGQR